MTLCLMVLYLYFFQIWYISNIIIVDGDFEDTEEGEYCLETAEAGEHGTFSAFFVLFVFIFCFVLF